MSLGLCKKCGKNMDLYGLRHNCDSRSALTPGRLTIEPIQALVDAKNTTVAELRKRLPRKPAGKCECPCCTLRREKMLAAVKKFRSKNRVPSHGDKTGP